MVLNSNLQAAGHTCEQGWPRAFHGLIWSSLSVSVCERHTHTGKTHLLVSERPEPEAGYCLKPYKHVDQQIISWWIGLSADMF